VTPALAVLASLAVLGSSPAQAAQAAQAEGPATRTISASDLRADFQYLYEQMQGSHYDLFARRSKAEYDARFRSELAFFDKPLPLQEAHVQFQKFLAYGRVAHARTDGYAAAYTRYRDAGGVAMPLGIRVVQGKVYVVDNSSGMDAISLGDEIVALNERPMSEWLERLGAYVSADNAYMMHTLLEFRFPALLWLEIGGVKQFEMKFQRPGGKAFELVVPARGKLAEGVITATPTLELDWDKREWRMTPDGVAYLRPGPFYEPVGDNMWDLRSFTAFIDGAFDGIVKAGAKSVVIDLRNNAGGDNSFSDLLVNWFADEPYRFISEFRIRVSQGAIDTNQKRLAQATSGDATSHRLAAAYRGRKLGEMIDFEVPFACPRDERFAGKVYLLINRHSYSNTVMVAALAQDYGFATIIGEETSDLSTTYGAMEQFDLPRTGLTIGFPKARIIRPGGDLDDRGVIPDIAIATPIVESKDDPVLQQALEVAREGKTAVRAAKLSPKIAAAKARQAPCRKAD